MCGSCGCGRPCGVCRFVAGVITLLLTLTTIAAAIGVWVNHMTPTGWVFGTVAGSVALVTFIISLVAWHKMCKKLCPCSSKGCNCGGGACPACGKDPCVCK